MIDRLKSLGSAPGFEVNAKWDVKRLWKIARIRSEKNRSNLDLLSVFLGRGVIPYSEGGGQVHKPSLDLSGYQAVYPGDLVLNNQQAWRGSVGVSRYHGIVSPAYLVLSLAESLDPLFADYLFQSGVMVAQFVTSSKGVGDIQRDIHTPWLMNTKVPIPTHEHQVAIVRFLDYMDRRIRRYIRAKQKLIKLLEEQKQAIIHRAVTRGLDPNVRLKPSGVEWLGDVPEHWKLSKLVRLTTRIGDGLHGTPEYVDQSEYYFINGNNLSGGVIKITPSTRCVSEFEFQKYKIALDDTTILMSINGTIGNVAFYRGESLILGKSAAYINCGKSLARTFLFFFLQSSATKQFFQLELTGTTIFNLSLASIRNLSVALPLLTEQIEISSFLESEMAEFDDLIDRAQHEISLLREYRTRLIADVITGKLDVREAAARLPAEAEESPEEVEALADGEGDAEDADLDPVPEEAANE